MQVFDASSMIYAWDNYPISQFPPLWDWMSSQIEENKLVMPSVAFDEVARKVPECGEWLREKKLVRLEINNAILQKAFHIKNLLGIVDDKYHSKGVGENDIFIIATAHIHGAELVSDEERQNILPAEPSKRKIPAVCNLDAVNVTCINFVEFIKRSGRVFR